MMIVLPYIHSGRDNWQNLTKIFGLLCLSQEIYRHLKNKMKKGEVHRASQ